MFKKRNCSDRTIYKSVVAPPLTPPIRMNHAVGVSFATNNDLKRSLGGFMDHIGVDAVAPFEKTKHDGLADCSVASFVPNALIDRIIRAAKRQTLEFGCSSGSQIKRKKAYKPAKLGLINFEMVVVAPVFSIISIS